MNNIIDGENQYMWSFRVTIEEGAEDAIWTTKVVTSALCITPLLATKGTAGGQLTHLGGVAPLRKCCQVPISGRSACRWR